MRSPDDAAVLSAWMLKAVTTGAITPAVAREISVGIKSYLAAFDVARLQARVKELAAIIDRLTATKE
jgi:hypothetical protein